MLRWLFLIVVLSVVPMIQAQDDETCPPIITDALIAVDENCGNLGVNNACYGFNLVSAAFNQDVGADFFTNPSDRAELTQLSTLRTAPLNELDDVWGVAVLNVQANVPNTLPGQAVTMILMGDASVQNQVGADAARLPVQPVDVVITSNGTLNVRSGAGTQFNVLGTVQAGQSIQVDGFNAARDWVRIVYDDVPAWISAQFVSGDETALAALPVVDDSAAFSPMQAFYFTTGIGRPSCNGAPDALVIQSPEGMIVNLEINGAEVSIGSTVVFTSTPQDEALAASVGSTLPFAVYPIDDDSVLIVENTPAQDGLPVSESVYIKPQDANALLIATALTDTSGLQSQGGIAILPETPAILPDQPIMTEGTQVDNLQAIEITPSGEVNFIFTDPAIPQPDFVSSGLEEVDCWQTDVVVIDGSAGLNDGDLKIPTGHSATLNDCYSDDEPAEWEDNGRLAEEELLRLGYLELIPEGLLRYPVNVPTPEEIDAASRPVVNTNVGSGETRNPAPPSTGGASCAGFVGTSPTDGMAFGPQTFYWNAGPAETDFYRVVVNATDRGGVAISDVGAGVTTLTFDMGRGVVEQFGRGLNFVWKVQAWQYDASQNASILCETPQVFVQREYISPVDFCELYEATYSDTAGACISTFGASIPVPN